MNFIPVVSFLRVMGLMVAPQDLPFSQPFLMRVLALYLITGVLVLLPGMEDYFTAVILILLDIFLLIIFLKFCLFSRNNSARFLQTLYACLGVGIFFQVLALPLVIMLNVGSDEATQTVSPIGSLFYLILVSWQVSVMAHILRHAMDMVISLTLLLSFSYLLMVIFISSQVAKMLGVG